MTDVPAAGVAKFKLPRKTIQVTYREGGVATFDSVKVAVEETGHSSSKLMRFAATGEADVNGDKYALVDHVPARRNTVACSFDDVTYELLRLSAEKAGKKVAVYARDMLKNYVNSNT